MQRRVGDARRAEAYYIITLTFLALVLLLANYVAWALLETRILADPEGPVALWFWTGQVGAVLLVILGAVIGFKPEVRIVCGDGGMDVQAEGKHLQVTRTNIQSFETISATVFHRHYRRYAATHVFVNRMPETLLLLHTTHGPLVIGFSESDLAACIMHLNMLDQAFFTPASPVEVA